MRKCLIVLSLLLIPTIASAATKRAQVVIPPRPVQPIATVPLVAIPPIAMVYDLSLRTSCDPRVILIAGDTPGFSPKQPIVGNFLLPAIYTRCGYPTPKWIVPALPVKP